MSNLIAIIVEMFKCNESLNLFQPLFIRKQRQCQRHWSLLPTPACYFSIDNTRCNLSMSALKA